MHILQPSVYKGKEECAEAHEPSAGRRAVEHSGGQAGPDPTSRACTNSSEAHRLPDVERSRTDARFGSRLARASSRPRKTIEFAGYRLAYVADRDDPGGCRRAEKILRR